MEEEIAEYERDREEQRKTLSIELYKKLVGKELGENYFAVVKGRFFSSDTIIKDSETRKNIDTIIEDSEIRKNIETTINFLCEIFNSLQLQKYERLELRPSLRGIPFRQEDFRFIKLVYDNYFEDMPVSVEINHIPMEI